MFRRTTSAAPGLASLGAVFGALAFAAPQTDAQGYTRVLGSAPNAALACFDHASDADRATTRSLRDCDSAIARGGLDDDTLAATHVNRALILRRLGRLGEAVEDCRAAARIGLNRPAAAVTCAAALIVAGEPEEAADLLLRAGPPSRGQQHKYFHNLALAHHDMGAYELAYFNLNMALSVKPGFQASLDLKKLYVVQTAEAGD